MLKRPLIVLVAFLSVSCASLNPIDAMNPLKDNGIDATAQIGAENNSTKNKALAQDNSNNTNYNDNKAETINQNYDYQMPPWILLLIVGLAGIAIENPFGFFKRRRQDKLLERLVQENVKLSSQEKGK